MEKELFQELLLKDYHQEVPSFDFTEQCMQKVEAAAHTPFEYQPILSNRFFKIAGIAYAVLFVLSVFYQTSFTEVLMIWQLDAFSLDADATKESLQLVFNIVFVLAALTLSDLLVKRKNELEELRHQAVV